jgi:hypothetical protein
MTFAVLARLRQLVNFDHGNAGRGPEIHRHEWFVGERRDRDVFSYGFGTGAVEKKTAIARGERDDRFGVGRERDEEREERD